MNQSIASFQNKETHGGGDCISLNKEGRVETYAGGERNLGDKLDMSYPKNNQRNFNVEEELVQLKKEVKVSKRKLSDQGRNQKKKKKAGTLAEEKKALIMEVNQKPEKASPSKKILTEEEPTPQ
eukprot:CAMPEP_0202962334 /NCGR_PEP_ID=MMETSP1396-20130829/6425_1 /ASSEMBLY_ACC=CAM_ASM_000872 /TAXON_ID= /ORGANISM="Pseudokeronopsis sp., Strain Brazil" /LENGTH=123 /DNA_ID=CAMNT_0049682827 /DNA_START=532 /DNA_END=903 /DNA_ORIENTATION=+